MRLHHYVTSLLQKDGFVRYDCVNKKIGELKMKRIIAVLFIALLFVSMPLFAKNLISVGYDVSFPTYDFGNVFRGDLVASYGYLGASGSDVSFGLYDSNSFRIPVNAYDKDFGFTKFDLSKYFDLYITSITGAAVKVPVASGKLDIVAGLGLAVECDFMFEQNKLSDLFIDIGAGARIDVIFNITDSIFLDFGAEGTYMLYEYYADFDYDDQGHGSIHRFNIPSCGLRAGIKL